jgi:hypothetical protein
MGCFSVYVLKPQEKISDWFMGLISVHPESPNDTQHRETQTSWAKSRISPSSEFVA